MHPTGESRPETPIERTLLLAVLCIVGFGPIALTATAVVPALPAMADRFGKGADGTLFAQLIMTLPAIMMIFGGPIAGFLAPRFGHRRLVLSALVMHLLAGSAGFYVESYHLLVITRLLLGLSSGALM